MSIVGDRVTRFPYVDPLITAYKTGQGTDHMHLGYWDQAPVLPVSAAEFAVAQGRLSDLAITAADLQNGQHILDIACGLGGTSRAIMEHVRPDRLVGINLDANQLSVCPPGVETVQADACDLPFENLSFDRAICLEAAFHFSSRRQYLSSVHRTLNEDGVLVHVDILMSDQGLTASETAQIEHVIDRDFGRWSEPWMNVSEFERCARDCGWVIDRSLNLTQHVLPSYTHLAPRPFSGFDQSNGVDILAFLTRNGLLTYTLHVLKKP